MRALFSTMAFVYFVSLFGVVPAIIYYLWGIFFFPSELDVSAVIKGIFFMVCWVVFGFLAVSFLQNSRIRRINKIAQTVTPQNFVARFEIYGLGTTEYFAVSPSTSQVVVVDLNRKVARCEAIDFVQTWETQDFERQTVLTISFNSFDFSTISFRFGLRYCADIRAKLTLALSGRLTPVAPVDISRLKP